jgi:ubiquitin-conjugating enzyme E2 W
MLTSLLCFDPRSWIIHIHGSEGTLYEGEEFVLQFKFNSKYPFDSPQVSCFRGVLLEYGGI